MKEVIKKDIINVLKDSIRAIKQKDILLLKDLSNHTIHDMSILQDPHSTSTAIIIYALAKIFERSNYTEYKDWHLFKKIVLEDLQGALESLEQNKIIKFESYYKNLLSMMDKLETKLKSYIKEILEKSKISKGSRVYEHGVSIGRAAEILGVTQWDLMKYTGETGIADVSYNFTKRPIERIKFVRGLFK